MAANKQLKLRLHQEQDGQEDLLDASMFLDVSKDFEILLLISKISGYYLIKLKTGLA